MTGGRTRRSGGSLPVALFAAGWVLVIGALVVAYRELAIFAGAVTVLLVVIGIADAVRRRRAADAPALGPADREPPTIAWRAAGAGSPAEALTGLDTGPTEELDVTGTPLPPAVDTGASHASAYFGGRVPDAPIEVRAACQPGLTHVLTGRAGQDYVGASWLPHRGSLLAVVADGLGSKEQSGEVARFAVRRLINLGWDDGSARTPLEGLVGQIRPELQKYVDRNGLRGATTLVAAEVSDTGSGATVNLCAVGDSEAWLLHDGGWTALYHDRDDHGTQALPRTATLASRSTTMPPGAVLVLATDGFARALGSGTSRLARELQGRLRPAPRPEEFANLVAFRDEYFTDDRGVVAVWVDPR